MSVNEYGNPPPLPPPSKGKPEHKPHRVFNMQGKWVGNDFIQPEDGFLVTYYNCRVEPGMLCSLEFPVLATWEKIP